MSDPQTAGVGHNKGPISPPFESDLLEDLKTRYPTVETKFDELMASAKDVPPVIEDDATAGKVQELLRNMTDTMKRWKADRGLEKGPWAKLADIAFNFFKSKEDKLDPVMKDIKDRHTVYLGVKAEKEEQLRLARAEEQRKEAQRLADLAKEKEEDAMWAEARQELAEWEERDARRRKAEAIEDQMWAEARAELAAYDEAQALKRKAEREAAEAVQRKADLKRLKSLNKEADALAVKDAAETITDDERDRYRQLIGQNGEIPALQAKLAGDRSHLSQEERDELEAEEKNLVRLRDDRVANHAAAEKAKGAKAAAQRDQKTATREANELAGEVKEAGREVAQLTKGAEKADARAGRAERAVEGATDADLSRTRSDLGTVGSLSGRWDYVVEDRDALVKYFGPLGPYLQPDAQDAAVYRYMRQHQGTFTQTPTRTDVPGVFFENVPESRIR